MRSFLIGCFGFLCSGVAVTSCSSPATVPSAVRIRWTADPQSLDPLDASTPQASDIINLQHCSLLFADPATRQYVPWLAQDLPTLRKRGRLTTATYSIRPEAVWDNGQPITARDVAYSLKIMNCPGLPTEYSRAQYGFVQDVELDPTNPRRFTLLLSESTPEQVTASGDYAILPEYSLDPQGTLRAVPLSLLQRDTAAAWRQFPALRPFVRRYRQANFTKEPGCGPYVVKTWAPGRFVRLERKPRWWADKVASAPAWLQAKPKRLEYSIIPDNATALLALRRGNIDLYPMPSARDYNTLRHSKDTATLTFSAADSYNMQVVGFNTEKPMISDAATRRALSLLFDVEGIIQASQPGLAYRSVSLINPQDKAAYNTDLKLLPFAPALATQQLRAAGWKQHPDKTLWRQGKPLTLTVSYEATNPDQELIALQFRAAAAQAGVTVLTRPAESNLLLDQLRAGTFDLYIRSLNGSPFAYNFLPVLHTSGKSMFNFARFSNQESDQLITSIIKESDEQRRAQLLRRFQAVLRQESPLVVLYFTRHRLIASRHLLQVRATSVRPGYAVQTLVLDTVASHYR